MVSRSSLLVIGWSAAGGGRPVRREPVCHEIGRMCEALAVMQHGEIVETMTVAQLRDNTR
ncbi:MAG: hypothetical protein E4H01_11980 [Lysobacterales bacterium]|nr:MAG: hypothetical protein E4H01_11980 [Xanthomonadales bacterium]